MTKKKGKSRSGTGRGVAKEKEQWGGRLVHPRGTTKVSLAGRIARAAWPATKGRRGMGFGAVIAVAEAAGGPWDLTCAVTDAMDGRGAGKDGGAEAAKLARRLGGRTRVRELAGLLSAVGSPQRLKLLLKLLEGPATYKTLRKATALKAGPLYHHVAQLRLAGLIGPKERDLYELTRGGRNLLLAVLTLPGLVKDRRPRPQASVPNGGKTKQGLGR